MGRTLHLLIAVATVVVALFGVGSGTLIALQFPGATLGPALAAVSAVGGALGIVKFVRVRGRAPSRRTGSTTGPTSRL